MLILTTLSPIMLVILPFVDTNVISDKSYSVSIRNPNIHPSVESHDVFLKLFPIQFTDVEKLNGS